MFAHSKTKKISNENVILDFAKGIIVAMLVSMGLIVLFALCLKWFDISEGLIFPITLLVKGVSVLVGSILAVKGNSKGLVKGVSFGLIYIFIAFVVFSLLAGSFNFGLSSVLDFAFSALLGGIVGIVKVNRK